MTRWLFWKPNWLKPSKLLRRLIGNMKRYSSSLTKTTEEKSRRLRFCYFFYKTQKVVWTFHITQITYFNIFAIRNLVICYLKTMDKPLLILLRSPAVIVFKTWRLSNPGVLNTIIVIDSLLAAYDASLGIITTFLPFLTPIFPNLHNFDIFNISFLKVICNNLYNSLHTPR